MITGRITVPPPRNEPVREYRRSSPETRSLKEALERMGDESVDIPAVIGGEEVRTGTVGKVVMPHAHKHELASFHRCGSEQVDTAADAAAKAWKRWSAMPWHDRAAVFLKAAELLSGPFRDAINAATMLGQSKTVQQAEIDSACELIDFLRFNCHFAETIYAEQPRSSAGVWNQVDYRPLEGFVLAVTPFNFTAIAGNLPTAPALMGNTVIWKPARTQLRAAWVFMQVLMEAGLPPGVINLLPGEGSEVGDPASAHRDFAGLHFTGSTRTFRYLWSRIGDHIDDYRGYPRIVGETGGKDFVLMHPSADVQAAVVAMVRGAFEYQGQKCSAASRAFVPASLWEETTRELKHMTQTIKVGDPREFSNFMGAVIDDSAYHKIMGYLRHADESDDHEVLVGGRGDDDTGYFIEPTVVEAAAPDSRLMVEEIFGPVLTIYRYEDDALEDALAAIDTASPYALTGAVFGRDREALARITERLRFAAGNFYLNDKPTGAVVGQQPFGGARASGTNDKAGSAANLLRWTSPRAIKETFVPPLEYTYPHMH